MAVLSTAHRNALPAKTFAGPHRSFPIPDANHAKAALSLVGRAEKHGSISPEQAAHIRAAAHAKLAGHAKKRGAALRKG